MRGIFGSAALITLIGCGAGDESNTSIECNVVLISKQELLALETNGAAFIEAEGETITIDQLANVEATDSGNFAANICTSSNIDTDDDQDNDSVVTTISGNTGLDASPE